MPPGKPSLQYHSDAVQETLSDKTYMTAMTCLTVAVFAGVVAIVLAVVLP